MVQGEGAAYDERIVRTAGALEGTEGQWPWQEVGRGGQAQGGLCPGSQRSREGPTEEELGKDPWDLPRRHPLTWRGGFEGVVSTKPGPGAEEKGGTLLFFVPGAGVSARPWEVGLGVWGPGV